MLVLLGGSAGPAAATTPSSMHFGRVYVATDTGMHLYKGKLPFQIVWPHKGTLKCFAVYVTALSQPPAAGSGQTNGKDRQHPASGREVTGPQLTVPRPPLVALGCPLGKSQTLTVIEFHASALKSTSAALKAFRIGKRKAYAAKVIEDKKQTTMLYTKFGKVGIEMQGPVPLTRLKLIMRCFMG